MELLDQQTLTYSTETTAYVPGANLTVARSEVAATSNLTHGYFGGGDPSPQQMDKLNFSTDTTTVLHLEPT